LLQRQRPGLRLQRRSCPTRQRDRLLVIHRPPPIARL
jgi:hypothetical protein